MLAVIVEKRKRWEVYLTIALENCTIDLTAAKMGKRNRWEVYLTTYMYITTDKLTAVKTVNICLFFHLYNYFCLYLQLLQ